MAIIIITLAIAQEMITNKQVLEELIFVEMKLTADRTDISACQKVEKIKAFIEQVILTLLTFDILTFDIQAMDQ